MNFERAYLAALDALIVALGGVVPVATVPNYQAAVLLRLVAIVQAVGGVLPSPSMNYEAAVLAHWRAAIAARGGVVPTVYRSYREGLLLHVQAFQATRGAAVATLGRNFEESILALLSAVPAGPVYDADALTWFTAVEAAGSVFASGAKAAYNKFVVQLKADSNLAPFSNGMLLAFAGFSGLGGCFVPLCSRGGALPTNIGFVSGQKSVNGLQGNGSAYIGFNIGFLAGQQNNHSVGFSCGALHTNSLSIQIGNSAAGSTSGAVEIFDSASIQRVVRSSSSGAASNIPKNLGFFAVNRSASNAYTHYSSSGSTVVTNTSSTILTTNMSAFAGASGAGPSNARNQLVFWGDSIPDPIAFRTAVTTLLSELGAA
ncbi:hypothetical protein IQ265_13830 [Nodosilinea sp. LEGE 06152]|uniref:hypothetical protein n=1 Tax=Nodosilinea sp. LEGE 06152 TaxID=2777966 RepID=UPI0018818B59|nr:hypothetical protein [Nodosilinea sp. LEGE 06152]MBE9157896.1 hypothetical protein [Nodosilinea sp. LEGE 06152]